MKMTIPYRDFRDASPPPNTSSTSNVAPSKDDPEPPSPLPGYKNLQSNQPMNQLRRYILEIVAFTLNADFIDLNNAMHPNKTLIIKPDRPNTILHFHEKQALKILAKTLHELRTRALQGEWNLTTQADRDNVRIAIAQPLEQSALYTAVAYIFELIATYHEHGCDPQMRGYSTIARHIAPHKAPSKTSKLLRLFGNRFKGGKAGGDGVSEALRAYWRIIEIVSPNEEVRRVLEGALVEYQGRLGVRGKMYVSGYSCFEFDAGWRVVEERLDEWL